MSSKQSGIVLRPASAPFTILLGREDYYLEKEVLNKAVDAALIKKKGWYSPGLRLLVCKKGKLWLNAVFQEKTVELSVAIEKDKLHIACNCGEQVETLCIHAFRALDKLCWFEGTDYFQQFRPGGLYEMAVKHKKYFTTKHSYYGKDKLPAPALGAVYALSEGHFFGGLVDTLGLQPLKPAQPLGEAVVLCYVIVGIRRGTHPPFVMPCMGRLNKTGTAVKNFYPFLTGLQKEYESLLTEEQKLLNQQCLALFKEAELLPGKFFPRYGEPVDIRCYGAYMAAWQKLWPLLQRQAWVFMSGIGHKRELRGKPPLSRSRQVKLSLQPVSFYFQRISKGPIVQLQLHGQLNEKIIRSYELPMLFLLEKDNQLHLLSSLVNAYTAEWMKRAGNRITVFKEHWKEFEKDFLSRLRAHYPVKRIQKTKTSP